MTGPISVGRRGGRQRPAYKQVAAHVRRIIKTQSLKRGARLPSERQIARRLSISHITVRKGLAELVEEGLIERRVGIGTFVGSGRPAPKEPDASVRLATIALAMPPGLATLPSVEYALQGVRRVFPQDDFRLEVLHYEARKFDRLFADVLAPRGPAGLILQGYLSDDEAERLAGDGLPTVASFVTRWAHPKIPRVGIDHGDLLDQAVREAYRFGHTELAMATWGISGEISRGPVVEGYQAACRRFGLLASADRVAILPASERQADPARTRTDALFDLPGEPTCLIVNDEIMASAVARDLEARGRDVPRDASLISLMDFTPHLHRVPLSAPDSPADMVEIFAKAAEILQHVIDGDPPDDPLCLHRCRLHSKASLGPAPSLRRAPPDAQPGRQE